MQQWCAVDEGGIALQYYEQAAISAASTAIAAPGPAATAPRQHKRQPKKPQPKLTTTTVRPRCRVLCLHGSVQSGKIFEKRLAVLLKKTKAVAEYTFVDAPHVLSADTAEGEKRCWWQAGAQRGMPHEDWASQWSESKNAIELAMQRAFDAGTHISGFLPDTTTQH